MNELSKAIRLLLSNVKVSNSFTSFPFDGKIHNTLNNQSVVTEAKEFIFKYNLIKFKTGYVAGKPTEEVSITNAGLRLLNWLNDGFNSPTSQNSL